MTTPHRLAGCTYVGFRRYFLTICTHQRTRRLADDDAVPLVHEQILKQAALDRFELTAYCYMPDHWHALATGLAQCADLSRFVRQAKQRSGWHFSHVKGLRLWQHGYYERVLRDEEPTPSVIEYIVNNPVRAGLVTRPAEYLHWGSTRYSREELLEFIGRSPRWRP